MNSSRLVYLVRGVWLGGEEVAHGPELAVDVPHGSGGQLDGQLQAHQVVHREP